MSAVLITVDLRSKIPGRTKLILLTSSIKFTKIGAKIFRPIGGSLATHFKYLFSLLTHPVLQLGHSNLSFFINISSQYKIFIY